MIIEQELAFIEKLLQMKTIVHSKALKIILALFVCHSIHSVLNAQDPDNDFNRKQENLFNNVSISHVNGFGGFDVQMTEINKKFAVVSGGFGGVMFNQKFFFGGYSAGLSSYNQSDYVRDTVRTYLDIDHSGFMIGYNYNPHKLVHWIMNTKLGWGTAKIKERSDWESSIYDDNIFVFNPEIGMELNVTRWFKINTTAGYRFISGIDNVNIYDFDDFNGISGSIGFLFGRFYNKN